MQDSERVCKTEECGKQRNTRRKEKKKKKRLDNTACYCQASTVCLITIFSLVNVFIHFYKMEAKPGGLQTE